MDKQIKIINKLEDEEDLNGLHVLLTTNRSKKYKPFIKGAIDEVIFKKANK